MSNLLRVVGDDLETDAQGQLVIATRVAADRLVSITDPEARHGRKTKSQTFNGFKVHLLGDITSGLLVSTAVTKGNVHDGAPAHRLIKRAKNLCADLQRVLADTAYGGARLRHLVYGACGVELIAPPPPVNGKDGKIGKRDVIVDLADGEVTCANGVLTKNIGFVWSSDHGVHVPRVTWPKAACDACPLSGQCRGNQSDGRRMLLHPYENELRAAREAWRNPETRKLYRIRTQCERLIHQGTRHGGRQARAFGASGPDTGSRHCCSLQPPVAGPRACPPVCERSARGGRVTGANLEHEASDTTRTPRRRSLRRCGVAISASCRPHSLPSSATNTTRPLGRPSTPVATASLQDLEMPHAAREPHRQAARRDEISSSITMADNAGERRSR